MVTIADFTVDVADLASSLAETKQAPKPSNEVDRWMLHSEFLWKRRKLAAQG